MAEVRLRLGDALGVGTGSCAGTGEAAGSLRGRLVQLNRNAGLAIGTEYALVVSNPRYSEEERFLNIIPLFDGNTYETMAPTDLSVHDVGITNDIGWQVALLPVSWVQNIFAPEHVQSYLPCELDDTGMRRVDNMLRLAFGL